jgi:hypothetical protein
MLVSIRPYPNSKIAVSFPKGFTPPVLNAVRAIPDRQWNNEEKIWASKRTGRSEKNSHHKTLQPAHNRMLYKVGKIISFYIYMFNSTLLTQNHINAYLSNLAIKYHVSPSTQNQAMSALLFYFRFSG